nr:putative ribonuclease H-like domain-containing protein [Tanacetum cinerariifolium]
MQEELLQFKMQKLWVLVDLPKGKRARGSKWVFRNKKDKRGIVIRNKARLVALGHTQEEDIDMVPDIVQKNKNEAKKTKPGMRMERVQEIEAEGKFILKQRLAKENELKAKETLLMALPVKHQLKFNIHKDAKSLMEAIKKRFE